MFFHWTFERSELEQHGECHHVLLVKTLQNMYVFPPKGQGLMLTSGHMTLTSALAKVGKNAYHLMCLYKKNTMRPWERLYLFYEKFSAEKQLVVQGHDKSLEVNVFYANNFIQKRDKVACIIPLYSPPQYGSNDMHFDPLWPKSHICHFNLKILQ